MTLWGILSGFVFGSISVHDLCISDDLWKSANIVLVVLKSYIFRRRGHLTHCVFLVGFFGGCTVGLQCCLSSGFQSFLVRSYYCIGFSVFSSSTLLPSSSRFWHSMCHAGCEPLHPTHLVSLVQFAVSCSSLPHFPHFCLFLQCFARCPNL